MKIVNAVLAVGMTMAVGTAVAQPAPYAPIPPPEVEVGPGPITPGPNYVLEPGHWQWNGVRYVWVGRHWILRHPGWAHFVPGHWGHWRGRWHWVPGHWV